MAAFINNDITTAGLIVLAKGVAGQKINYTKIVLGDGYLEEGQTPRTLTGVVSPKATVDITKLKINGDGTITDQFGDTISYQTVVSGRATAYYAKAGSGTSTGRLASYGVVAVDPKVIPYGTKMFICSADGSLVYGYAIAGDTGGTLMKGTVLVDLYYNNYNQCVWFGSKKMNIYILE